MFSLNRFDPSQHTAQTEQPITFNPLARLNQRLDQAKSLLTTQEQQDQETTTQKDSDFPQKKSESLAESRRPGPRSEASATPLNEERTVPLTKKQKARIELGFTGANSIPLPSKDADTDKKPKSSAKLKYLKKKKERAKSRKRLLRQSTKSEEPNSVQSKEEHSLSTPTEEPIQDPTSTTAKTLNPQSASTSTVDPSATSQLKPPKRVKRPKNLDSALEKITKKKIKTDHESTTNKSASLDKPEEEILIDENNLNQEEEKHDQQEEIITQPGALPRFPAPTNSSRPDPQLLARLAMGLGYSQPSTAQDSQDFIHFDSQSVFNLDQIPIRPSNSLNSPSGSDKPPPFSLSTHSVNCLTHLGFKSILAVQIAVFSILMPSLSVNEKTPGANFYPTRNPPRDLCVNAPTGSGKTLSYVIPIIETLKSRLVCQIRALIVLPTRDLVLQVKSTFDTFSSGTGLKAAILTGHHSFTREQALLGRTRDGLEGLVDVVIATPGRLIDHLAYTPGFSTDHLCFLVLDEADQLLNKNSQNWLHQILIPTKRNKDNSKTTGNQLNSFKTTTNNSFLDLFQEDDLQNQQDNEFFSYSIDDELQCKPSKSQADRKSISPIQSSWTLPVETYNPCRLRPFRILLFSATLKRDPTQVDHLGLRNPIFIKVSSGLDLEEDQVDGKKNLDDSFHHMNGFSLPSTLKQHIIVTRTDLKPLVFIKLVMTRRIKRALCFCKSIEGAERLTSLCKFIFEDQESLKTIQSSSIQSNSNPTETQEDSNKFGVGDLFKVECFSSDLSPAERSKLLKSFQLGQVNMLICSDMIARGIDIPQVENVINYDSPIEMKKYVHRVGRTARANQLGFAFTLIESQEAKFFKNFFKISLGQSYYEKNISKIRFNWFDLKHLNDAYQIGLKKLAEKYGRSIDI